MSICTLPVRLRNSLDHDGRERSLEVDTDVVFADDSQDFEHVDGVESDLCVLAFDRGDDTDIPCSDLGIPCGYLESRFTTECDTGIVVVLTTDEIGSFERDDEVVSHHDSFGGVSFREEVPVVWEVSVEQTRENFDSPEYHEELIF